MNSGIKLTIIAATMLPLFAACSHDKEIVKRSTTTTTYTAPQPPPVVEKHTTITTMPE